MVFFGREKMLNLRVVLKQFDCDNRDGLLSEIKVFSLLANTFKKKTGDELMQVISHGALPGLPHMLAYRVSPDVGEVLMTHGGMSL